MRRLFAAALYLVGVGRAAPAPEELVLTQLRSTARQPVVHPGPGSVRAEQDNAREELVQEDADSDDLETHIAESERDAGTMTENLAGQLFLGQKVLDEVREQILLAENTLEAAEKLVKARQAKSRSQEKSDGIALGLSEDEEGIKDPHVSKAKQMIKASGDLHKSLKMLKQIVKTAKELQAAPHKGVDKLTAGKLELNEEISFDEQTEEDEEDIGDPDVSNAKQMKKASRDLQKSIKVSKQIFKTAKELIDRARSDEQTEEDDDDIEVYKAPGDLHTSHKMLKQIVKTAKELQAAPNKGVEKLTAGKMELHEEISSDEQTEEDEEDIEERNM